MIYYETESCTSNGEGFFDDFNEEIKFKILAEQTNVTISLNFLLLRKIQELSFILFVSSEETVQDYCQRYGLRFVN